MKYIENIQDIPNIEKHLDKLFYLVLYDKGDNTQIYEYDINSSFYFSLIINSLENVIEGEEKLINLITQDNIIYLKFSFNEKVTDHVVDNSSWVYKSKN